MTIFARLWLALSGLFEHLWADNGPAIMAWGKQFLSDEGKVILADTAVYGQQIFAGTITITDAANKVLADLEAKGIADAKQYVETVFNALRTHTNLAANSNPSA
jgi:hypothetical protein